MFSMVGLNKTKTRNSLALDGTLLSIMTVLYVGARSPLQGHQASKCVTNIYNRKNIYKLECVLSLSHTHTQLDIHAQGKYCNRTVCVQYVH